MTSYSLASRIAFCAFVLAVAVWGHYSSAIRRFTAYGTALLVMVYVCSLGAVVLFGWIPAKGYLAAGLAFLGGAVVGVIAGVVVGKVAMDNATVYWLLVAAVAGVIAWLKPLV
jgi:hypothetical protein